MAKFLIHFEGDMEVDVADEDEAFDEFGLTDDCAVRENINFVEVTEVE